MRLDIYLPPRQMDAIVKPSYQIALNHHLGRCVQRVSHRGCHTAPGMERGRVGKIMLLGYISYVKLALSNEQLVAI